MARKYQSPVYFSAYADFIANFEDFLKAQESLPPLVIRRNHLKCDQKRLDEFLTRHQLDGAFGAVTQVEFAPECFEIEVDRGVIGGMWEHHNGLFYIQGASSVIPVLALEIKPGERVLDMCAAPGGKTAAMAQLMQDQGVLIANEPSHTRRRVLKANIDRMGATNVVFTNYYGEKIPEIDLFDKILLDGPCSAEGSLRGGWSKRFDYHRNDEYRAGLQRSQAKLLKRAFELLKPGGRLVYSTCTYDPMENEYQVSQFLSQHENALLIDAEIPGPWCDGITSWQGKIFDERVKLCKRIYPHKFNSWGFFFATFIKQ